MSERAADPPQAVAGDGPAAGGVVACPNGGRSGARAAAFGDAPGRVPRGARDPEERWLVAVALGGQGHYAAAAAELERLAADPGVPPPIRAHAAVTRAAHLRQLGGHAAARAHDARALRLATAALRAADLRAAALRAAAQRRPALPRVAVEPGGPAGATGPGTGEGLANWAGMVGAPAAAGMVDAAAGMDHVAGIDHLDHVAGIEHLDHVAGIDHLVALDDGVDAAAARIDALVGLAADAVGLGDPDTAERLLAVAGPALAAHPSWRPGVRAGWVRAELALVRGRAAEAVAPAEAALAGARRGGSLRHVLKSRIVLAVAGGAAGTLDPAAAVAELDAARAECADAGLLPLVWPAALAALDLQVRINEQVASSAGSAPGGRTNGATRRRHAARAALSVVEQRSDALGKRQMGESVWIPQPATLM